jgi:hypothetical protein
VRGSAQRPGSPPIVMMPTTSSFPLASSVRVRHAMCDRPKRSTLSTSYSMVSALRSGTGMRKGGRGRFGLLTGGRCLDRARAFQNGMSWQQQNRT